MGIRVIGDMIQAVKDIIWATQGRSKQWETGSELRDDWSSKQHNLSSIRHD